MADVMLQGFAPDDLGTVSLTIGQIFQSAATHDEIQDLFAEGLDITELERLLAELACRPAAGWSEFDDRPPNEIVE